MRQTVALTVDGHEVDWVVLVEALVLWVVLVLRVVLVIVSVLVTVTVTAPVLVEVLVVLWARAGKAIVRPARTTATVKATRRHRPPSTQGRCASLALFAVFIARLP